jgi:hypothetical protein
VRRGRAQGGARVTRGGSSARWTTREGTSATRAPVDLARFELLRENAIFRPLPVDTLERLCHDLQPVEVVEGAEIVTQGEAGERFYLIGAGEVDLVDGRG